MRALLAAALVAALPASASAARIVIVNGNDPGVGFNDPTPAAPIGGNSGTTLGQQRLIAFQRAADLWGAELSSPVTVEILATFTPLACDASSAVLGSAGTASVAKDFPGAKLADTWYPAALANKLAGRDLTPGEPDIVANFNSELGTTGCLDGSSWYLGLDANEGAGDIDLVAVLLHEFGHGLGFANFMDDEHGTFFRGTPDAYSRLEFDDDRGALVVNLSLADRKASAMNGRGVSWAGASVTAAVPKVLARGTPFLTVTAPAQVAGRYDVGTASFGPALTKNGVSGTLVQARDGATTTLCTAATNAAQLAGSIAVVDRGTCTFVVKAQNAQAAGATAMIVVDNVDAEPPAGLGGSDPSIGIPAVRVSLATGTALKAALPATAKLALDTSVRAGADPAGRALLYTPRPYEPGSSVSHWDTIGFPNQLMEPFINDDLEHEVAPPYDLTLPLLKDIGW